MKQRQTQVIGRPIVRPAQHDPRRIIVLCPRGHLYQSVDVAYWPGSALEMRCGDPNQLMGCDGTHCGWWTR